MARVRTGNREAERDPPWIAREVSPGDWRPVRPRIPGLPPREPLKATTEAKPKPPQPDGRPLIPPYVGPTGAI